MRRVLILILVIAGTACAYKPDVKQGNVLEEKNYQQLKPGMSRQQVVFLMGTSLLQDPFHQNRWDYVFTLKQGHGKTERQLLTLYFDGDVLSRIDDSQLKKVVLK